MGVLLADGPWSTIERVTDRPGDEGGGVLTGGGGGGGGNARSVSFKAQSQEDNGWSDAKVRCWRGRRRGKRIRRIGRKTYFCIH